MEKPKVLVVDDEIVVRHLFQRAFRKKDYGIEVAKDGPEAVRKTKRKTFNVVITDLKMPGGMSGLEVLKEIKKYNPYIEIIIATGFPTVEVAVEAMKIGAVDFVCKPLDMEMIHSTIMRCLEQQKFTINHIQLSELEALFEMSKAVRASLQLDSIVNTVLDFALGITKSRRGALFLLNETTRKQELRAVREKREDRRPKGRTGSGNNTVQKSEPATACDSCQDFPLKEPSATGPFLTVPLISNSSRAQDDQLGAITITEKISGERFTERDHVLLTIIAGQAAVAIENTKLYNELEHRIATLKQTIAQLDQTQAQLIQTEKMAAMGKLAFGIAHEIKNPLAIVLEGVEFLCRCQQRKNEELEDSIQRIKRSVYRANTIINELLKFSRTAELKLTPMPVCTVLDEALALISNQAKLHNVRIVRDYQEKGIEIEADATMLRQAVFNLFHNALDAMPHGGKLSVGVRVQKKQAHPNGTAVLIKIADTGEGIPRDITSKIFDPFFTTKEPGKGTGLGLSIVHLIMERHNAAIEVKSEVQKGTTFTITFPGLLPNAKGGDRDESHTAH